MKRMLGAAVLLTAFVALASLGAGAQQGDAAPPGGPAAGPVTMADLTFADGTVVTGRLVKEDAQTVQVTSLAGSSIGYRRELVQAIRRYSLQESEYAERKADFQAGEIWKAAGGPGAYTKARDEYQAAILLATAQEDRDRLQAKVDALEREREALQAEDLRRQDLQKARDQAELVRLQQSLTQQQIAALQAYEPRIQRLEQDLSQTRQAILTLQDAYNTIGRALDQQARLLAGLQDDLTILQNNLVYVPYPVFVDPRRPRRDDGGRGDDGRDRGNPGP